MQRTRRHRVFFRPTTVLSWGSGKSVKILTHLHEKRRGSFLSTEQPNELLHALLQCTLDVAVRLENMRPKSQVVGPAPQLSWPHDRSELEHKISEWFVDFRSEMD
jgi:hypothetical protein